MCAGGSAACSLGGAVVGGTCDGFTFLLVMVFPRRMHGQRFCNSRIASPTPVDVLFVGVGWCCFGWVWAFHGLFFAERGLPFAGDLFVESLILAQDERWRRA